MEAEQTPGSTSNSEFIPSIPELFEGKCVLVTGATGSSIGKVLVEKLLRSCPGLQKVFILLSPYEKERMPEICRDFLRNSVFNRLRKEWPDSLRKVKPIIGYLALNNLGLSEGNYNKIIREISFVFHCASDDRFNGEPRNTMYTNLLAVERILEVCESCEELEALVHVSTAFSFCNYSEIAEQTYPELVNPVQIIETLRWMDDDQFRSICKHYIQGRPSVYHFSKALAETLIAQAAYLPVIIVRPPIVAASVEEPFPGWIDNCKGPSEFLAECGNGIVRTLLVKDHVNADLVPVDIVANTLIVAAHYMAVKSKLKSSTLELSAPSGVPIINCICPEKNRITWMKIMEICLPFLVHYPSMEVYGKPGVTVTTYPFQYNLCRLMSHYIPAVLIDGARYLTLRKPKMIRHYKIIHRKMSHLTHYTTHPFFFHTSNMQLLIQQMSPEDKELFSIDQSTLDWTAYMKNYVLGVRRFLLKEKDETLPEARTRMMRIHYFLMAVKLSSLCGIFLFIRALKKRDYIFFPSLLPSFPYITSAIAFIQRKLSSPLLK